jgi:hypothetical protein
VEIRHVSSNGMHEQSQPTCVSKKKHLTGPCFFVLCKRHWINRVPGEHQGDSLCIPSTLTLTLVMPSYL